MRASQKTTVGSMKSRLLLASTITVAVALVGTRVLADDAADIEQFYSSGAYVVYDDFANTGSFPVITAIGSQPGTFGGHSYSGWSVFVQDSTGSLDLFTSAVTLTTLTANAGATLSVGDALKIGAPFSPFHQIPEIAPASTLSATNYITKVSTGNTVPTAPIFTVNQIAAVGSTLSNNINIAGFYLEIQNVTITGTNGFTTNLPGWTNDFTKETFTVTDNTGSMTMFDWTTSYSACTMLSNTPIGVANQYNAFGFVSYNTGGPLEFTPLSLVAVPEPSTILLAGSGLLGLLVLRRRRS